jgi:hypothetical protein
VFGVLYYCLAAGMRNGDRPGDAEITALLSTGTQPDEARPVIVVQGKYETIGVAPADGAAELAVPVTVRARRYVLTAAVGQEGGRLRVHRLRLGPVSYQAAGRDERFPSATLR